MQYPIYKIAIDPGLSATGWAVFCDGRVDLTGTVRPDGQYRLDKLLNLASRMRILYAGLCARYGIAPAEVTIEQWEGHSPIVRFQTMVACAEARGIIMAISCEFANTVKYLSKGKAKKSQADLLARSLGITGSEHARDAVHLGALAGYLREG